MANTDRIVLLLERYARGALEQVLRGWAPRREIVHAVFASRRGLLPAVRSLIDFLAQRFADDDARPARTMPSAASR
jgi:DNA-binding transcriptional LysR family regulator